MPSPVRGAQFKVRSVNLNMKGLETIVSGKPSRIARETSQKIKARAIHNTSNTMVGVITGDLRRSIRIESRKLTGLRRRWTISADTPYAVHVHNGFTHNRSGKSVRGRPYLAEAVNRIMAQKLG